MVALFRHGGIGRAKAGWARRGGVRGWAGGARGARIGGDGTGGSETVARKVGRGVGPGWCESLANPGGTRLEDMGRQAIATVLRGPGCFIGAV